jgi:phosphatidylserine/phosphatidylglycerophosphate/cardiolipin synthase-like enzyme
MRRSKKSIGYLVTGLWIFVGSTSHAVTVSAQVCFTPGEDCAGLLINEINHAQQSILVQAYSFTAKPIAEALVAAEKRGVDVKVILDRSQVKDRRSVYDYLIAKNIPVWIDSHVPIAHSKVMIFDQREVASGSYNYSKNAQSNSENMLILNDSELAKKYTTNWNRRLTASQDSTTYAEYVSSYPKHTKYNRLRY